MLLSNKCALTTHLSPHNLRIFLMIIGALAAQIKLTAHDNKSEEMRRVEERNE